MSASYVRYLVKGYANGLVEYMLVETILYASPRYGKTKTVPKEFVSDGATKAVDIKGSRSWWVHDAICRDPVWDDGTPITAWEAATVISDILEAEGMLMKGFRRITRAVRSKTWRVATFLFGCRSTRKNGWI